MSIVTRFLLSCSILFPSLLMASSPALSIYHLDNGLTLVVKPDHRAPVVTSEVWYKIGSSYESLGKTGLSHMLEHLMFKGTPKHPGNDLLTLVTQNGGELNAFTTRDFTAYYENLAADKLPLSFELEADRMANLSLDGKTFDSEHQVVKEERQLRITNDPQSLTFERFSAVAFPASPYQNPTIGWPNDLDNMTNQEAKDWYHHWYGPNNAIVIVVGDVDPEQVYALAKTYFGPLKPITLPLSKPYHPIAPMGSKKIIVEAPAKLPYLLLGYNTPSAPNLPNKTPAYQPYALEVLSGILGGTESSRLQQHLVRDKQIATDVDVSYDLYSRLPGLFIIGATPAQGETIADLKKAIFAQIHQLQTTPISQEELDRIKTQVIANHIYAQDSISFQAYLIGSLMTVGLGPEEIDHYQTAIQALTPEDIQKVAQAYLITTNLTMGELVPLKNKLPPALSTPNPTIGGATHVE